MSDRTACLFGFGLLLFFLGLFAFLAKSALMKQEPAEQSPMPKDLDEAISAWREAMGLSAKLFVMYLCSPMFLRKGLYGLLVLLGAALATCLAAICGADAPEVLKQIRLMLQDLYNFIDGMRQQRRAVSSV